MLRLTKPADADLQRILDASRQSEVTYDEVGATRTGDLPSGYRLEHYERTLGSGEGAFERAVAALRAWQSHVGAGVDVFPRDGRVETGATVVFVFRALGPWAVAPCRVVYVGEEPSRFRFAYGTLPGHPERGEVAIAINRDDAGAVTGRVDSFSRTVDPVARAALPLTRLLQKRLTSSYLDALAART